MRKSADRKRREQVKKFAPSDVGRYIIVDVDDEDHEPIAALIVKYLNDTTVLCFNGRHLASYHISDTLIFGKKAKFPGPNDVCMD